MIANYKLSARFLDPHIQPTERVDDSFFVSDLERIAKFVVIKAFRVLKATDHQERTLEIRNDLVRVLFCPVDLKAHHIDIALSQLRRPFKLGTTKYTQLDENREHLAQELMNRLVLGGGVAGIRQNEVIADWGSSSFQLHLDYDRPSREELAENILDKIKTLLYPIFNLSQI